MIRRRALVESYISNEAGFARGLEARGFAEAQNLAIEYRFANGRLVIVTVAPLAQGSAYAGKIIG